MRVKGCTGEKNQVFLLSQHFFPLETVKLLASAKKKNPIYLFTDFCLEWRRLLGVNGGGGGGGGAGDGGVAG